MQKTTRKRKRKRKEKEKKKKGHSEIIKDAKISLEKYIYIYSVLQRKMRVSSKHLQQSRYSDARTAGHAERRAGGGGGDPPPGVRGLLAAAGAPPRGVGGRGGQANTQVHGFNQKERKKIETNRKRELIETIRMVESKELQSNEGKKEKERKKKKKDPCKLSQAWQIPCAAALSWPQQCQPLGCHVPAPSPGRSRPCLGCVRSPPRASRARFLVFFPLTAILIPCLIGFGFVLSPPTAVSGGRAGAEGVRGGTGRGRGYLHFTCRIWSLRLAWM